MTTFGRFHPAPAWRRQSLGRRGRSGLFASSRTIRRMDSGRAAEGCAERAQCAERAAVADRACSPTRSATDRSRSRRARCAPAPGCNSGGPRSASATRSAPMRRSHWRASGDEGLHRCRDAGDAAFGRSVAGVVQPAIEVRRTARIALAAGAADVFRPRCACAHRGLDAPPPRPRDGPHAAGGAGRLRSAARDDEARASS